MHYTLLKFAVYSLVGFTEAFWRMPCPSRLMDERIDPIITPGMPSGHVHTVSGGNGMNWTVDYPLLRQSTCSSCPIKEDLSVYWTPKLYYHNSNNGSFTEVPQAGDGNGVRGGMTVYYLQRGGPNNDKLQAFPEGFRMVAGNPFLRNYTDTFQQQAISFNCLNYNGPAVPETNGFPNTNCPDGLRAQVFFPSCWDGKNLDSPDHVSHMSYPEIGAYNGGTCPQSHPVHLISIFYEVIYQTNLFADMWHDGKNPFVFAMGDPTGYGFHGDFINGWDVSVLQNAVDNCLADSGDMTQCPFFSFFPSSTSQACSIPPQIHEPVRGPLARLPGCNAIQAGPGAASPPSNCPAARAGSIGAYRTYFTDETRALGWRYLGCAPDDVADRTFGSPFYADPGMTVELCIAHCAAGGSVYAGVEYGTQCFCGSALRSDRMPVAGVAGTCTMRCGGDAKEFCGGAAGLTVYQKCDAGKGDCVNARYQPVG